MRNSANFAANGGRYLPSEFAHRDLIKLELILYSLTEAQILRETQLKIK